MEVLKFDTSTLPDSTFFIDKTNEDQNRIIYRKLVLGRKYFDIFSALSITEYKGSLSKDFVFSCLFYEFGAYSLKAFIKKIVDGIGEDDSGLGYLTKKDVDEIDKNRWSGRRWLNNKHGISGSLEYDEETGLFFTVRTL